MGTNWNKRKIINVVCACLAFALLALLAFAGLIIFHSLDGNPGSKMGLMGLIVISPPMGLISMSLIASVLLGWKQINSGVRTVYLMMSGLFVLIFPLVYFLG